MGWKEDLIQAAKEARGYARAAYSRFRVGAALETRDGRVFRGCNVENATFGLTVCAERVAVWKALSEMPEDKPEFRRIAIVTGSDRLTPPCGACRQILWEYCGDIEVILANTRGDIARRHLRSLFPQPFEGHFLGKKKSAPKRSS